MTMHVLLATDGSSDAQVATAWLTGFPLPDDTHVRVVTVAAAVPSPLDIAPARDFQASLHQEARAVADGTAAVLADRFRTVEARALAGDPREELMRMAEEWPADLVVLGARGLSGVAGFFLGSVSLAVARHAPCAVLVVKEAREARALRGALVAVDGSEESATAAAFLARLPLGRSVNVQLVGVVEPPRFPSTAPAVAAGVLREAIEQVVAERRTALTEALSRTAAVFGGRVPAGGCRVAVGHPVDEIVRAAADAEVDVVVMGARGLGTLKRLLLGSVSEGVLRHADRPVLIVRGGRS
ncbi:MAG TPA: universal stress protein [Methylomirabilota bacterium]|jgi:nucleotide-binding universal stress UspA family protein